MYVTLTLSTSPVGVTVTVAVASFAATVGASGFGCFTGSFAVPASLASLLPFVATALTSVPSLATVWSNVTTPLVESTFTPGVGVAEFSFHTPPSFTISMVFSVVPPVGVYVTLTLSTSPVGVTVTVAVSGFGVTTGAAGRVVAVTFTLTATRSAEPSGYVTKITAGFEPAELVSGAVSHVILVFSGNLFGSFDVGVFFIKSSAFGILPFSTSGKGFFSSGSYLLSSRFLFNFSTTLVGSIALSYIDILYTLPPGVASGAIPVPGPVPKSSKKNPKIVFPSFV